MPPRILERAVGILIPAACREEVLGDLHERYTGTSQYLLDASRTVPLVIVSRIRRSTDPAVLLMEAFALFFSFLLAAWYVDRTLLTQSWGLWRLAIPVGVALLVLILRDAYVKPVAQNRRSPWEAAMRPVLGIVCAFLSRPLLFGGGTELALPWGIMLIGGATSIFLISTLRMAFPPVADLPRGAGGPPFWQRYVTEWAGNSDVLWLALRVAAAIILASVAPVEGRLKRRLFLTMIFALAIYQVFSASGRKPRS